MKSSFIRILAVALVFAGGTARADFLDMIGIGGTRDVSEENYDEGDDWDDGEGDGGFDDGDIIEDPGHPGDGSPIIEPAPGYPRHPGGRDERVSRSLNRILRPGQIIPLRELLGLEGRRCGLEVESVDVVVSNLSRFSGELALTVNGSEVGVAILRSATSRHIFTTGYDRILCREINRLQLRNVGRSDVHVRQVAVTLSRGGRGRHHR
jgi:hypothetical protein